MQETCEQKSALFVAGLWNQLDLHCWSCFSTSGGSGSVALKPATMHYRLAASAVAAGLAVVAIGCLIWAQRQVRFDTPMSSLRSTANCIIIDHFSAFESGLVAPFLYAA